MTCPNCGKATLQTKNTRTPDSHAKTRTGHDYREAERLVGWYSPDWVMRQRICPKCAHKTATVEVSLQDLMTMFRSPHCPR